MKMTRRLWFLALFVPQFSFAQQSEDPRRHIRFFTLGELPVWKEEVIEGIRTQLPAEPGQLPPRYLRVTQAPGDSRDLRCFLRKMTGFASISPESEGLEVAGGDKEDFSPWLKGGLPANRLSLGVLYRDHQKMSWLSPKLLVLKDDLESFPLGTVRFTNVSESPVWVLYGKKERHREVKIDPGTWQVLNIESQDQPVTIECRFSLASAGAGAQELYSNRLPVSKEIRTNVFFYKPQDPRGRKPVLMKLVAEEAPVVPKAPRTKKAPAPGGEN